MPGLVVGDGEKRAELLADAGLGLGLEALVPPVRADDRRRLALLADLEIGAGQQHRAAFGHRLPAGHHPDDGRRRGLLANQRLFVAGLKQNLARPVLEPLPDLSDTVGGHALIAAGRDQPVDDLGIDRVGERVGGCGRGGEIAVVEELDGVAETDRADVRLGRRCVRLRGDDRREIR